MNVFLKIVAGTMISLIVYLVLTKQNKDFALLISICACCMILTVCISYFVPVFEFFKKLETLAGLDTQITGILLKAAGIGVLSEICAMICTDAGNSSLAKAIQLVATAVVLYISLPLFEGMIELVAGILGEL